ncbi:MAG TPA: maleylpyruvate isomerase family mycothiol-dependent enzyme [Pilimelia sp.]|nr:maleylpyruvate isomerase family mycothiol-dependent enzyme [Pilimelia sp.]
MTVDPLVLMAEVDRATDRLLRTATGLDGDAAIAAPSLLPGWTRGHVLAHLARNADGLTNLLTWARTGVVTPQYASGTQRADDIAAGAPRGHAAQVADVREAAERFAAAAAAMPPAAWATVLDIPRAPQPAATVVWRRLREVEVHHVDLAAGYTPADWPVAFGHRLLHEVVAGFAKRDDAPPMVLRPADSGHDLTLGDPAGAPVVRGTVCALAAWLTGRSAGADLTVAPPGPLPTPPAWI